MAGQDPRTPAGAWVLLLMGAAFICYGVWAYPYPIRLLGLDLTLNDQAAYVAAARRLIAEGTVASDIIYPSTLLQEYSRNYLYMPGHAAMIGLAFLAFGDSALVALLPSIFAYGICLLSIYVCGRMLFGRAAGLNAAAALAMFPLITVYAFTAMAELTFLAAGMLAFTGFVSLPGRLRPWAAPWLLLLPFLCRETGALWVIPMVVLTVADPRDRLLIRLRSATVLLIASLMLLGLVYQLEWIADRPSLLMQNLLGASFADKYTDAYAVAEMAPTPRDYLLAVGSRSVANLASLWSAMTAWTFEAMGLHLILWGSLSGAVWAWRARALRPLVLAWVALASTMGVLTTTLYQWHTLIGLRQMLMPTLLGLLTMGAAAQHLPLPRPHRMRYLALGSLLALGVLWQGASEVAALDAQQQRAAEFLANVPDPGGGTIVTDWRLGPIYVFEHPLRRWSFVPATGRTMLLLDEGFDVRVALLTQQQVTTFGADTLARAGLQQTGRMGDYLVFEESGQR